VKSAAKDVKPNLNASVQKQPSIAKRQIIATNMVDGPALDFSTGLVYCFLDKAVCKISKVTLMSVI